MCFIYCCSAFNLKRINMIDVSNDLGYYLNQASHKKKKLVGVLYPNGDKRCFLEHCHFNELNGKVLYQFEDEDSFNEWYDA